MNWLVITARAEIAALTGVSVLTAGTLPISPVEAQDVVQAQLSYTCRFENGPRAGQSLTYTGISGPPISIGVPCADGQGSTGSVVPDRSNQGPAPVQPPSPVQPPPNPPRRDVTFICRFENGPRSGQTQSYAGVTGIQAFPVGGPCTDGQGSTGVAVPAPPPPPPVAPVQPAAPSTNFTCHFDNGPRAGETQSYAGVTGIQPMQVGAQCTDGQGSTGAAVPDVPPPAPAQPATPSPPAPGPLPPLPELAPPPAPPPPAELPQTSAPSPPHSDRVPGAAVGASVRGLAGAKWADPKNSGFVTGYTYRGRYHPGAPAGYDPTTATVLDRRAAPGKLFPPPPSAIVGGRIRGEPGAVWADLNNDGVADGYVEDGRYFPGVPPGFASGAEAMPPPPPPGTFTAPPVTSSGERG